MGSHASVVRIELTGSLRVVGPDGDAVEAAAFPGRQGRLLFARLATRDGPIRREELAEELWPDGPPPNWKRDLSVLVSKLRSLLRSVGIDGREALRGVDGCYELCLPADAVVDVDVAVAQAAEAPRALAAGRAEQALTAAGAAIEVARRGFFPGEEAPWVSACRWDLEQALLAALDVAAAVLCDRGELGRALSFANEALDLAPFRESAYVRLMRVHLAAGDRAEALRTYARCQDLLSTELGVDPAPETEAVYLDALRAELDPAAAAGAAAARPGPSPTGNLPAAVTSFVGRDRDVERVATSLGRARLVTLTGAGGVGKSRLAVEVATRLAPAYPDGAWRCELARVTDGAAVAHAVVGALGIHERPELTVDDSVVDFLRPKRLLLVMDNCEHVLDAVAGLLEAVLAGCPQVAVLATSRARVALDGEHVLPVEPLTVPAPGTDAFASIVRPAAVQLFCDRAAAVRSDFALTSANAAAVAEVCRRLDGVPLAIELAAARLRSLSVGELAQRLDERFELLTDGPRTSTPRQRTLLATVGWSYDLLTSPERLVFERLSMFAGPFTLSSASDVCADIDSQDPIEAVLTALVDQSMVGADTTVEPTRYRLLETLRAYGRDRLAERGAMDEASHRHAVHHVALAESASSLLRGPDEARGAALLDAQVDDLRAAHRWCIASGDVDLALRLSAALHWYAIFRVRPEVSGWAEEATELPGAPEHPLFPEICDSAGSGCWMRGDFARATELGKRGLDVAGSAPARRFPRHCLGDVALLQGRLDEALTHYTAATAAAQEDGDDYHRAMLLGCQALVRTYRGERGAGLATAEEARRVARATTNPTATAWALHVTGEALLDDDPDRAIAMFEASADLARAVANTFVLGVALLSASSIRTRHGDPASALATFTEVVEHWHRLGNWTQQWTTLRNVIDLLVRLGVDGPAAVLLGAVHAADTAPAYGPDADRLDAARGTLESRLGRAPVATAMARGGSMDRDEIVAFTRNELRRARTTLTSTT